MIKASKYLRYIKSNGWVIFFSEVARLLINKIRALFYRRIFLTKLGSISTSSYIRGLSNIYIGSNFSSGKNLWLEAIIQANGVTHEPKIEIGKNVSLSNDVHISAINYIRIADDVLIGSRVYIGDHNHGNYHENSQEGSSKIPPSKRLLFSKGAIKIGNRVWIGDGVIVTGGISIEDGAVIAANTVVTKNVPRNAIFAGVPGKVIGFYE